MNEHELLGLYREMYLFELQHREVINSGLGTAIGVAALIGGALAYLIRGQLHFESSFWDYCYFIVLGLAVIFFGLAVYNLGRAWFGRVYAYIAPPLEWEEWRLEQMWYHGANPEDEPGLEERLQAAIIRQVAAVTTENRTSNRIKSQYAFRGRQCLLVTVAWLGICLVPLAVLSLQ